LNDRREAIILNANNHYASFIVPLTARKRQSTVKFYNAVQIGRMPK
jgi:hypothetical protein